MLRQVYSVNMIKHSCAFSLLDNKNTYEFIFCKHWSGDTVDQSILGQRENPQCLVREYM